MYMIVFIVHYNYHSWVIRFMTTYNSNVLFNYLVLDAFLPNVPTEVTALKSFMCTVIQEKKCISLIYGPDKEYPEKRLLQWVLEAIDTLQNMVSKILFHLTIFSITQIKDVVI